MLRILFFNYLLMLLKLILKKDIWNNEKLKETLLIQITIFARVQASDAT